MGGCEQTFGCLLLPPLLLLLLHWVVGAFWAASGSHPRPWCAFNTDLSLCRSWSSILQCVAFPCHLCHAPTCTYHTYHLLPLCTWTGHSLPPLLASVVAGRLALTFPTPPLPVASPTLPPPHSPHLPHHLCLGAPCGGGWTLFPDSDYNSGTFLPNAQFHSVSLPHRHTIGRHSLFFFLLISHCVTDHEWRRTALVAAPTLFLLPGRSTCCLISYLCLLIPNSSDWNGRLLSICACETCVALRMGDGRRRCIWWVEATYPGRQACLLWWWAVGGLFFLP